MKFLKNIILFATALLIYIVMSCEQNDLYSTVDGLIHPYIKIVDSATVPYNVISTDAMVLGENRNLYAVIEDHKGNYIQHISVEWSVDPLIGTVSTPVGSSTPTTTFTSSYVGKGRVIATNPIYNKGQTGLIAVTSPDQVYPTVPLIDNIVIKGRSSHADVVVGNQIHFFGGWDTYSLGNYNYPYARFDTNTTTWITRTDAQMFPMDFDTNTGGTKKYVGHSAVNINGMIYIFGGTFDEGDDSYNNYFYRFNPSNSSTLNLKGTIDSTGIASARAWHTAVIINGEMHVFGGVFTSDGNPANNVIMNDHYVFTPGSGWAPATINGGTPPSARYFHCAAVYDNKMYIFGGEEVGGVSDSTVYIYDNISKKWLSPIMAAGEPSPRIASKAAFIGNILYIYGGQNDNNMSTTPGDNKVYSINVDSVSSWTNTSLPSAVYNRSWHTFVNVNNQIYIYGGYPRGNTKNYLYVYKP